MSEPEFHPVHRFFLPPDACAASTFPLSEADSHHADRVLRLREGDEVSVLDGQGGEILGSVVRRDSQGVWIRSSRRRRQARLPADVTLVQSILKGKAMDWTVEKATELGVRRFVPFQARRSVSVSRPAEDSRRCEAWRRTSVEAAKQCGNAWLPEILTPASLADLSRLLAGQSLILVAALSGPTTTVGVAVGNRPLDSVAICVGPEGDFTPDELEGLRQIGARPVTLGPHVLRAETAAISATAIVQDRLASGLERP